jgi:hypothetical protein
MPFATNEGNDYEVYLWWRLEAFYIDRKDAV